MPHTARRHGRTITLTGRPRRIAVTTRHPQAGDLDRGTIHCVDIRNGRPVWQPVTPDYEWLAEVVGDFVQAEAALLDATAGLDEPLTAADLAGWETEASTEGDQ